MEFVWLSILLIFNVNGKVTDGIEVLIIFGVFKFEMSEGF
jgi:hypothetical protein